MRSRGASYKVNDRWWKDNCHLLYGFS